MSGAIDVETFDDPLAAVRRVVGGADEALLGVAFVQHRGVNLLEHELRTVPRSRLVTTTAFGSTTAQGLAAAQALGLNVRVLNPSRGTFHPKLYVARHDDEVAAAIGSANLTSGLVANVEAGAILRGHRSAPPMVRLWELAESWWEHVDAVAWSPERVVAAPEVLAPDLLAAIMAALCSDRVVRTIADGKENWVQDITPDGVWVETTKSRAQGRPPQLVEAWMIQIAWDWLQAHGSIAAKFLVADDGLNVKRSSFVCALLARLPDWRSSPDGLSNSGYRARAARSSGGAGVSAYYGAVRFCRSGSGGGGLPSGGGTLVAVPLFVALEPAVGAAVDAPPEGVGEVQSDFVGPIVGPNTLDCGRFSQLASAHEPAGIPR